MAFVPLWLPCLRVDIPADASARVRFETTRALGPLLDALENNPLSHALLSLSAGALEAFEHRRFEGFLTRLRVLADERRIEMAGTAADDALLPLLPDGEVHRQLERALDLGRRVFGDFFSPWVFWPPALAATERLCHLASSHGYSAMLVDENALDSAEPRRGERIDACASLPGFHLLPVNRRASRAFADAQVRQSDGWRALGGPPERQHFVITSSEVSPTRTPPYVLPQDLDNTLGPQDLLHAFSHHETSTLRPFSALTTPAENARGLPFARWHGLDHRLHDLQWQLAYRMAQARDELEAKGLHAHPAAARLSRCVDLGWRRAWWEAASRTPRDETGLREGLEARKAALAEVRPLLSAAMAKELEVCLRKIEERLPAPPPALGPAENPLP